MGLGKEGLSRMQLVVLLPVVLALLLANHSPSLAQRPLIMNHTFSSLPMSQHASFTNSWPGAASPGSSGKQLRNGRLHEQPLPLPQPTSPVVTQYEDYEVAQGAPGSRRDNKRRLAQLAPGLLPRPSGSNGRRGIESLRKELMNPSVGGPGGGISGSSAGYPSYSATSSIGRIDGLGQGIGSADRYGEQLRQPSGMAAMTAGPLGGAYSTRFPPLYGVDDTPKRMYPRKNSISELYKLKTRLNQADEPAGGVTHGNFEGDGQGASASADPLQEIKDRIRDTSPNAVSLVF